MRQYTLETEREGSVHLFADEQRFSCFLLKALFLQVQFAFHLAQDLIIDLSLIL